MNDKVSIIVPIYNVEQYLKKCIDSILEQTYTNLEVLLIDDCTKDKSGQIAKQFEEKDSRCRYIKREKNGGLSAARNTGMKYATGKYICFIDSDDWLDKNYIKVMLGKIKEDDADIVVCDYWMAYDTKKIRANSLEQLTDDCTIQEKVAYIRNHTWTKMFRKEFFEECGLNFPEDIKRAEDIGIIIPLLTYAREISIVNEPLYYYRQRDNSLSNEKKEKKINLEFYDKTVENMLKNANDKYSLEIEYHAIIEMMYGKTMLMLKHNYSFKEIKNHLRAFDKHFKNWKKNKYIKKTNRLKRIFIKIAGLKLVFLLKIMVVINEKRKK